MSIETSKVRNGTLIAISAAALILAGCAGSGAKSASAETVHCAGINSCKGTGACKTAENACKGQNVCKGHGFLVVPADECSAKGGTVI